MHADLVLTKGRIYTVDTAHPWAEAVAVMGERIVAAGTNREMEAWMGPRTQVIDLGNRLVLPGFFDCHVHFMQGGQSLLSVQLRDAVSREEFTARIAAKARELPKGEWITQGNWNHHLFPDAELPRKNWIDAVTPDHPVCIRRMDGHMVLCNSLALRLAGVDRTTPTPDGGEIVRDLVTAEPTGILKEGARNLVFRVVQPPTSAHLLKVASAGLQAAAAKGVTSLHDVSGEVGFEAYQELLREGRLTSRIFFYVPIPTGDDVRKLHLRSGFGSTRLRFAGLKGFIDGSLGAGTALFFEPYTDEPGNRGIFYDQMFPEGVMRERILAAYGSGLRVTIHAIGDRAIATLLDIYEDVAGEGGACDQRFRIEHVQHLRPGDLGRLVQQKVIASVQPYHAIDDGCWAEGRIGRERALWSFAYRTFLDAGVRMAFGSDWPMSPMDPILGIYAAVTRRTLDGRHPDGWIPSQKIPLEAAIYASTMGGAYAEFAEAEKGSITPGKLADFVVLDRNLFEIPPEQIRNVGVSMTICGGSIVFQK